jgi:hypothetical protein
MYASQAKACLILHSAGTRSIAHCTHVGTVLPCSAQTCNIHVTLCMIYNTLTLYANHTYALFVHTIVVNTGI